MQWRASRRPNAGMGVQVPLVPLALALLRPGQLMLRKAHRPKEPATKGYRLTKVRLLDGVQRVLWGVAQLAERVKPVADNTLRKEPDC